MITLSTTFLLRSAGLQLQYENSDPRRQKYWQDLLVATSAGNYTYEVISLKQSITDPFRRKPFLVLVERFLARKSLFSPSPLFLR